VREDLETIRQAIGMELPFGRLEVLANLWSAACGLLMASWSLLAPAEYRDVALVLLALIILGLSWCSYRARKDRGARPWTWREHKLGLLAAAIITPCVVAYMRWERHLGMPREMAGASALVAVGLGALLISLVDRRRRYYLGGGVALIAFGIFFPLLTPTQVIVAAGIVLAAAGISAAVVQTWQLHNLARPNDSH
jgi:hypothetical protein